MNNRATALERYFDTYRDVFNEAVGSNHPDTEQTARFFTSCFLAANPSGVSCGQNNETFCEAVKQGYTFYKNIGITSMEILSKKITLLDDYHSMVAITWRSNFTKPNSAANHIDFENIYFIQTRDNDHKIFAYITGDEQAALKKAGLL